MDEFYKSYRIRCLAMKWKDRLQNLHLSQSWQPFEVTDSITQQHSTETLYFVEANLNRRNRNLHDIFKDTEVEIGSDKIILSAPTHEWKPRSDQMYPKVWTSSVGYLCTSAGIMLKDEAGLAEELHNWPRRIEHEITHNPTIPFQHSSSFLQSFGIRNSSSSSNNSMVAEFLPFWASIEDMKFEARKVVAKFKYPLCMKERLNAFLSTQTIDSKFEIHRKGVEVGDKKDLLYDLTEVTVEYALPATLAPLKQVRLALSLDERFSLHFLHQEISPPKLDLWTILQDKDASPGRILKFFEGETGKVHIDRFEYAIGLLLTSLGFRAFNTGELFEPGPDILAVAPNDRSMLVVECGRKKIDQKISNCKERVDELRRDYPQYEFLGIVFASNKISDVRRREITSQDIVLLDRADIEHLRDAAVRIPNPEIILNSFKRALGSTFHLVVGEY